MLRALAKWGGIGCGGLIVLAVLIALAALVFGGGGGAPEGERKGGADRVLVRVTGDRGVRFSGAYGNTDSTRSVDGTTPAEFAVRGVDTGSLSTDVVTANMQKTRAGSERLTVQIVVGGRVVKEASTTAEYGTVDVTWSPQQQ